MAWAFGSAAAAALGLAILSGGTVAARQAASARGAAQAQAPDTTGGVTPIPFEVHDGFRQIFNGTSLDGWDGDPRFWRAEGGAIVGESTPDRQVNPNTFCIWRGGEPANFELKVEFRINNTNSGVQYRSKERPEIAKWVLSGYQADIDFANSYTGMLYEERGRGFLAPRGMAGYADASRRGQIGALDDTDTLKSFVKVNDWNQFHVIANGTTLIHILNGHVTALFVDEDAASRSASGLLGFQLHMGQPMKVEFRNIWLKTIG
jgi:hypothetical protein